MGLPQRTPFFYGWVILALGTVGTLFSAPGQTVGVSAFTDYLIRDLALSRTALSLTYLIGTLVSSVLLSSAGRVYDRRGARTVGTAVAVALGVVLVLLGSLPEIVRFIQRLLPALPGASIAFAFVTLGFFLLRFFGQGVLALVSRNMVLKWFEARRGLANSLVGMATTLGFSATPVFFTMLIGRTGWQDSWRLVGLVIAIPFAAVFVLLARDNPQDEGMKPDGGLVVTRRRSAPEVHPAAQFTLREARRTYTFWVFVAMITLSAMYFTGLTFNIVSIFEEAGLSSTQAVSIFVPSSVIALTLSLVAGWASDHIRLKYLLLIQAAGIAVSAIGAATLAPGLSVVLLIVGHGVANGMFGIVMNVPWPRFYGTHHLGAISGFATGLTVAGSAVGPFFFSLALDLLGSYAAVSVLTTLIALAIAVAAPWANRPAAPPVSA